jgi:hypothetical protein
MKKITLLLSFIACVGIMQAQTNLVNNFGFEEWNENTASSWTTHSTDATVTKESTIVKSGNFSLKQVVASTANSNPGITQVIPATAGKTYTLSFWYYVETGDDSDIRIWSSWKNGTTFIADKTGMQPTAYAPSNKGNWTQFSIEVTAPATTTDLGLEVRTYKGSTVYLDDFFFGEKVTGISNPQANQLEVKLSGKTLTVTNSSARTVEIYSTLGAKVATLELINGATDLNLGKGLYIVRAGNKTAKIRL